MIELLGPMPKNYALAAKNFHNFFVKDSLNEDNFVFRKIDGLKHFPLDRLLTDKYRLQPQEAKSLADFLLPMLKWRPGDRPPAHEMLQHEWLTMPDEYDYRMSEKEWQEFAQGRLQEEKERPQDPPVYSLEELAPSDDDLNMADDEDNVTLDSESADDSVKSLESEDIEELNGSFRGGYVPNRDIFRVDKG